MTANQMILLFDLYRGFTLEAHCGTLQDDLFIFYQRGLIGDFRQVQASIIKLSPKGQRLINILLEIGSL